MLFLILPQWRPGWGVCIFVLQNKSEVAVKRTVVIVGATSTQGAIIARELAESEYHLLLTAEDGERLIELQAALTALFPAADIEVLDCLVDASWEADIIILSVSPEAEKPIAQKIREVATGKIVISLAACDKPTEELANTLPYSKIVRPSSISFDVNSSMLLADGKSIRDFIEGTEKASAHIF